MEIKVQLNNLRIAPRKSRQVVDLVRGREIAEARALLEMAIKRGAEPVLKLLNSAVASAVNDLKLTESNLFISKIIVGEGPTLKRNFPMSRGKAYPIMKRTSHITLVLSEKKPKEENKKAEVQEVKEKSKKINKLKAKKKAI